MRLFLLEFLNDYLPVVLITLFCLIVLSFRHKSVRYFLFTMIFLMSSSIVVYGLYKLGIVGTEIYLLVCEIATFLIYSYEVIVSIFFHMQGKLVLNMEYVHIIFYTLVILDNLLSFDLELLYIYFSQYKYILKYYTTKILYFIKKYLYITQDLSKDIIVLNC